MNYHRLYNKQDYHSNLISTPATSSLMKLTANRHEKSSSLLKLPPIRSSKALLSGTKKFDHSLHSVDRYKTNEHKESEALKESTSDLMGSPLKRILITNKANKENREIDLHQKNLKERTGLMLDLYDDLKLFKSPANERKISTNHEVKNTPKSEQMHLPKMTGKKLEGISDLKLTGLLHPSMFESQNKRINALPSTMKNRDQFQFFFNPTVLLNDNLIDKEDLPKLEPSKCSSKKNGVIKAYAANTHQGLIRNYNEDRVAIILNIIKPANKKTIEWPSCSYFAIYDGHGGSKCAEFLRDNLHHYVY